MAKITKGYEKFIRELDKRMAELGDYSTERLRAMIETTQEYLDAAGDLTKDEWALIARAVRQDLTQWRQGYAQAWEASGSARLLTEGVWHWLVKLSDTTQIEWQEVSDEIHHHGVYRAGEYIGLGELECTECGQKEQVWHPQPIHACRECGGKHFYRHPLSLGD